MFRYGFPYSEPKSMGFEVRPYFASKLYVNFCRILSFSESQSLICQLRVIFTSWGCYKNYLH